MVRDMAAERALAEAAASVFATLGGDLVDPPTLMDAAIPLDLSGEAVRSRLCVFPDERGQEIALRPDLTLPVALAEASARRAGEADGEQVRRYVARAFRLPAAEDFDTEFTQVGFERYGAPSTVETDIEVFDAVLDAIRVNDPDLETAWLGDLSLFPALVDAVVDDPITADGMKRRFRQGGAIRVPSTGDPSIGASRSDGPRTGLGTLLATASRADAEALVGDMLAMAGVEPVGTRGIDEIVDRLMEQSGQGRTKPVSEASLTLLQDVAALSGPADKTLAALSKKLSRAKLTDLDPVLERLARRLDAITGSAAGMDLRFATSFGRRFNYYDGFLFEVFAKGAHALAPLAAGGRYDTLLASLSDGAADVTAIGGVVRPDRMALAPPSKGAQS